jgi:tetratricopeptide (TPR) repeat protein
MYNNVGNLWKAMGKLDEATTMLKKSVDLQQKIYGKEHSYVANAMINLAEVYQLKGNMAQAEQLFEEGLNVLKKVNNS